MIRPDSHLSNPESHAARMSLLKVAVRKVPFSVQELRQETPHVLPEIVRGQVRRLESEGLITRISKGVYIATCVVHKVDLKKQAPDQDTASYRMPKDKVLAYLATPHTIDDVQKHFKIGRDSARSRLRGLIAEECLNRQKIGLSYYYAVDAEMLSEMAAKHEVAAKLAKRASDARRFEKQA